jgi:hypothetical protein
MTDSKKDDFNTFYSVKFLSDWKAIWFGSYKTSYTRHICSEINDKGEYTSVCEKELPLCNIIPHYKVLDESHKTSDIRICIDCCKKADIDCPDRDLSFWYKEWPSISIKIKDGSRNDKKRKYDPILSHEKIDLKSLFNLTEKKRKSVQKKEPQEKYFRSKCIYCGILLDKIKNFSFPHHSECYIEDSNQYNYLKTNFFGNIEEYLSNSIEHWLNST